MTTVSLISYFTFPEASKPKEVTLDSVKLPVKGPQTGLITLYGFRDSLEELSKARLEADAQRMQFATVDIQVEAGIVPQGNTSLESLEKSNFLNVRRINKDVEKKIAFYWMKYLKDDGINPADVDFRHGNHLMTYNRYYDRLRTEPEFSHIDMIAFPIREGSKVRHTVALFGYDHVKSIEAKNFPEITLNLPKLPEPDGSVRKLKM